LFIVFYALNADDDIYSARFAYGEATSSDLGEVVSGNFGSHPKDLSMYAFDMGYLLSKDTFDVPLDIYIKGGASYFNEDTHDDVYEVLAYIKFIYNFNFWDNRVRLGFGEGVSYVSEVLETEHDEAYEKNDNTSRFLNYLDITIDFDIGRLVRYKPMHDTYIGFLIKHRSGIFGLINDVKHGGSNYNSIYIEKNF
jgi:outer membrane protein